MHQPECVDCAQQSSQRQASIATYCTGVSDRYACRDACIAQFHDPRCAEFAKWSGEGPGDAACKSCYAQNSSPSVRSTSFKTPRMNHLRWQVTMCEPMQGIDGLTQRSVAGNTASLRFSPRCRKDQQHRQHQRDRQRYVYQQSPHPHPWGVSVAWEKESLCGLRCMRAQDTLEQNL